MLLDTKPHRQILVLVVEDDDSQSILIEKRLRLASFAVDCCRNVDEACRMVEQREYAVAVIDLNLGGESGLEVARILSNWGCKTRVILHSVETCFQSAKEGINLGVFAYVEKGANADQLVHDCHRAASAYLRLNLEAANDEIAFQLRLLDAVDQGIIATDLAGNIIYWNRFSTHLTGISSEAAMNHSIADFLLMTLSESKSLLSEIEHGGSWHVDCQLCRKVVRSEPTPIRLVATGLRDSKGVLNGSVLSYHDMSLTLARERSLQQRAKLLLLNAELARSAVEMADQNAFLDEALKKIDQGMSLRGGRVLLWKKDPLQREVVAQIGEQVDMASERMELDQLEISDSIQGFRIPLVCHGEVVGCIEGDFKTSRSFSVEKRDFLLSIESLAAGVLLRNWAIAEKKLSDKRVLEQHEQLSHVQRTATIGHMAAILAHEINQPLGSISNFAGGLLCGLENDGNADSELSHTLRFIRDESIRAGAIVGRLRKYVAMDRFNVEKVIVNNSIQETLQILKHVLNNAKVLIELDLDPYEPLVHADAIRLQQVFVNVVKNSIEAMHGVADSVRTIRISSKQESGWVQIEISDNGPTINEANFDSLFQPYCTTKPNGLGMGLAISRSIVEQHHGSMVMKRIQPNGMMTTIRIPATYA